MDNIVYSDFFAGRKAALIDMDGVLYDSMPGHTLAWKQMMDELGIPCSRDEFYLYEGMTGVATINLLMRRELGIECEPKRAEELYEIKSRNFRSFGPPRLMPGADRMLAALKKGGLARVLVTGSGQNSLLDKLDSDYPGMFGPEMKVTAHDVERGKPDPEPYLRGASKAGVDPAEAIVVENAPLGVRAGKAAGCFTIAVTTGPIPREEFEREGADIIFSSMEEFADFLERQNDCFASLFDQLRKIYEIDKPDNTFLITDSNLAKIYPIKELPVKDTFIIPAGEDSKNIEHATRIWGWLSSIGATRRSLLVNFGGGVVSDIGGFCASTFKRGIRFVNIPTTLLAQADAAIGGKTGIDFSGYKNEVGTFASPLRVIIDSRLLSTLPREEIVSGLAEVVKMALLTDAPMYNRLINGNPLADSSLLAEAIRSAADTKERIVDLDPSEAGSRKILNLGHTAGHAFEMLATTKGNPISHGCAVAYGIAVALLLSEKIEGLNKDITEQYAQKIVRRYYPPFPFGPEDIYALIELMKHDKKNVGDGQISFVLLSDIGRPIESVKIQSADVIEAIKNVKNFY